MTCGYGERRAGDLSKCGLPALRKIPKTPPGLKSAARKTTTKRSLQQAEKMPCSAFFPFAVGSQSRAGEKKIYSSRSISQRKMDHVGAVPQGLVKFFSERQ